MRFNSNVRRTAMPPLVELPRRAGVLSERGVDVIRVDQGAVDIPPPQAFVERVADALRDPDVHRYSRTRVCPSCARPLPATLPSASVWNATPIVSSSSRPGRIRVVLLP